MVEWIEEMIGILPECDEFVAKMLNRSDWENREDALCHVWAGAYNPEPAKNLLGNKMRKNRIAVRRERKVAENRKHYARVMMKGVA